MAPPGDLVSNDLWRAIAASLPDREALSLVNLNAAVPIDLGAAINQSLASPLPTG